MDSAPRRYWQLPVFVLGLVAMAAAYKQFPPPHAISTEQSQSTITEIQNALLAKPNAWESVEGKVKALDAALDSGPVDSQAAYTVGSWHVAAAEYGKPVDAKKHWERAANRFSQVDAASLETVDAGRFVYRMAKVEAMRMIGKPPETLLHLLNPPAGEDTTFRGTYAYAVAMRMTPPETTKAKLALNEFLTGPGAEKMIPAELARYKFKLGELLLNDQQPGDAVTWLQAATGPNAEPDVRGKASMLLGRACESLKDGKNAITHYQRALTTTGVSEADLAHIRMLAAEGLVRLDQTSDAVVAFAKAAQFNGPVGVAAACRLAHLNAKQPSLAGNRVAEVEMLKKCFQTLKPNGEFDNPHVTLDDLRLTCEQVISVCVKDGDMPSATAAMAMYERVGAPGRAKEIKAEALQALAYTTANRPDPNNKAAELHKQAAAEFDALATAAVAPTVKIEALRKAATSYLAAGDASSARQKLTEASTTTGVAPEQLAMIRMSLAEVSPDAESAASLLKQVIDAGGPTAFGARVKLGENKLEQANQLISKLADDAKAKADWTRLTGEAGTLLEQAAGAAIVTPLDQPAHEKAMFLLGRLKLFQGKHAECVMTLKSLLQRYPQTKDAEKASLYLGSALLVEGTVAPGQPAMVEESIALLTPLMTNAKDANVRSQAGLRVARAHLAAKRWQDAVTAATTTADASKGTVEELIALSLAYNGYAEQKRTEQMTGIEKRMREVYQQLPDTLFNGTADEYRRNYWRTTWFEFFDKKQG